MRVVGRFQMIAGKPSVIGVPDSWPHGFDDWEIPDGAEIVVTFPHVEATDEQAAT